MARAAVKASLSIATLADGPGESRKYRDVKDPSVGSVRAGCDRRGPRGAGANADTTVPERLRHGRISERSVRDSSGAGRRGTKSGSARSNICSEDDPGTDSSFPRPAQRGRGLGIAGA